MNACHVSINSLWHEHTDTCHAWPRIVERYSPKNIQLQSHSARRHCVSEPAKNWFTSEQNFSNSLAFCSDLLSFIASSSRVLYCEIVWCYQCSTKFRRFMTSCFCNHIYLLFSAHVNTAHLKTFEITRNFPVIKIVQSVR